MDKNDVKQIRDKCLLPDTCTECKLVETHISWVLLTDHYAFKIKRPVEFSFLDFSTPEKRKFFGEKEIELNRRLAPEMYLDVLPVNHFNQIVEKDDADQDDVKDYAVKMKRMDNSREMDKMLLNNKINETHLDKIAQKVAFFHQNAKKLKNAFDTNGFREEFAAIEDVLKHEQHNELHDEMGDQVRQCISKADRYLNDHRSFFNERIINGFQRDCHGDLNATNIFVYDDPVIFDCIEFNSDFRFIDILNEIAFLCVDLDFWGKEGMSDHFYEKYIELMHLKDSKEDRQLFAFYKAYRANIRAKVTLLNLEKKQSIDEGKVKDVRNYLSLMNEYTGKFSA